MANENCLAGWRCPECGHEDSFKVGITRSLVVHVTDDGTQDEGGDTEFNNDDDADCCSCLFSGIVHDFIQPDAEKRRKFDELISQRFGIREKINQVYERLDEIFSEAIMFPEELLETGGGSHIAKFSAELGFLSYQDRMLSRRIDDGIVV